MECTCWVGKPLDFSGERAREREREKQRPERCLVSDASSRVRTLISCQ